MSGVVTVDRTIARILAGGTIAVVLLFFAGIAFDPNVRPVDLIPSICAGDLTARGVDPYLTAPLAACERASLGRALPSPASSSVAADPIAPAVVAAFALASPLPLRVAVVAYAALICAAFALTIVALARTLSLPWWLPGAALACVGFAQNASLGQLIPLTLAALSLAGWALAAGRPRTAAAFAALTLFQANFGVPVVVALALFVPRARLTLAAGAAAFALLSLAGGGLPRLAEFARDVVPAQTLGEIAFENQIGLGWIAWCLGVPPLVALRLAEIQSIAVDLGGIWAAGRVARRLAQPAAIVFVPAAAAVTFGPYLHANHLALAVPLALLLAVRLRGRSRALAAAAIAAVSLPVVHQDAWMPFAFAIAVLAAAALAAPGVRPERVIVGAAFACVGLGGFERAAAALPAAPLRQPIDPAAYAAAVDLRVAAGRAAYDRYLKRSQEHPSLPYLAEKLPLWFGTLAIVALAARTATRAAPMGNQTRAEGG